MDALFLYVSWLGSILVLLHIAVSVIAVFRRVLNHADMYLMLGGLLGASLIAHLLKLVISRPRPMISQDMLVSMPADFFLPSAHPAQA